MSPPLGWSYHRLWPPDPVHVATARDFVASHLIRHHLTDLHESAALVVSELTTNAIRHADTSFSVTVRRYDLVVVVSVRDGSPQLPRVSSAGPLAAGGRGLRVVEAVSDAWGMRAETTGKSVWASFGTGGR